MTMSRYIIGAALVAVASGAGASTPTAINQRIGAVGAKQAVSELSDPQLDAITKSVATGDSRWLRTAMVLRRGSDGARTEGIDLGFSQALATNPAGVLRLIRDNRELDEGSLCEDRSIEPSAAQVRMFTDRATKALHAVKDRSLASLRDACLASLHTSSASVR